MTAEVCAVQDRSAEMRVPRNLKLWTLSTQTPLMYRGSGSVLCPLFSFALNGGGRIFLSPASPLSSLLCSLVSLRDSLCTALQTKRLWIWSTGLLMQLTLSETWVSGNLTAPTERSQRAIRWTRGRGGESCVLRLFPWRTVKISTYSEPW